MRETCLVSLDLLQELVQSIGDQDVVVRDQIGGCPAVSCEPCLDEWLCLLDADFFTVERSGLESKAIFLVRCCLVLNILCHDCTEVSDFFEIACLDIEVAAASCPRADEL